MTGTTITENRHAGGYLVSQARGERSLAQVTLKQQAAQSTPPTNLTQAGTVLGQITTGLTATAAAKTLPGANTGTGTVGAITLSQGVLQGVYNLEYTSASAFNVFAPAGDLVGEGVNASVFALGGLSFTVTAGGTAFVAGDAFNITVAANASVGVYAPLSLTAQDGSQVAAAILYNTVDATGGNIPVTVHIRDCEVNGSELIYPAGATAAQITAINAQLAMPNNIIVR